MSTCSSPRNAPYHGQLNYMDFLKRVWPLDEMPSHESRFTSATSDIATHMSFQDWEDSYLLYERLRLSDGPDAEFLRFLETVVHPLRVPNESAALNLVADINRSLERDGLRLVEADQVSGNLYIVPSLPALFAWPLSQHFGKKSTARLPRCETNFFARRRRKDIRRSVIWVVR